MSKLAALLGSNSGLVVGAGAVAVAVAGAGAYVGGFLTSPPTPPAVVEHVAAVEPEAVQPKPATATTTEPQSSTDTPTAVAAVPASPSIDEVRNEADGLTVIAGRAEAGSDVVLLVDGVEATTVQAGRDGAFAIITMLVPNGDAQVLRIVQRIDGTDLATDDIILAPRTAPPVALAVAEPVEGATPDAPEVETETKAEAETPDTAPEVVVAATDPAPAPEPVAILKSDADGVEILNRSSAPEVMSNVAIDTISYSQTGDVLLSGRAQSQASAVRVYLNNAVITTLSVDTTGRWRGDLPDVDTGIYTLRVDEVTTAGEVSSRVETPFKREAPEVLAAAQNDTGASAKAVTVQTGATLWAIARDRYGDGTLYVRVVEANKGNIRNPDLIYPGQVFELPE